MTGRENIYLKGYVLGLEDSYIKQIEEKSSTLQSLEITLTNL